MRKKKERKRNLQNKELPTGARRALKASGTLVVGLVLLIASEWVLPHTNKQADAPTKNEAQSALSSGAGYDLASAIPPTANLSLQDPFAVLNQIERSIAALPTANTDAHTHDSNNGLPADIPLPNDATTVYWDSTQNVFSFEMEGHNNDVLTSLCEFWHKHGWDHMPLGDICGATFIKQTGTYHWMLVTCTQINTTTCVVGKVEP